MTRSESRRHPDSPANLRRLESLQRGLVIVAALQHRQRRVISHAAGIVVVRRLIGVLPRRSQGRIGQRQQDIDGDDGQRTRVLAGRWLGPVVPRSHS